MNILYSKTGSFLLLGMLSVSAACRENETKFGFDEIWELKSGKILVFDLNPLNWMFGVSGGWAMHSSGEKITWGSDAYGLEADFGKGWVPIKSNNSVHNRRVQLYYHSEAHSDVTVGFPAAKLCEEILSACDQRGLDSCRIRIKYRLPTKLFSPTNDRFSSGPELESDWILLEVKKKMVYLIGYWELDGYRGYRSIAERDEDNEHTLKPPIALNGPN